MEKKLKNKTFYSKLLNKYLKLNQILGEDTKAHLGSGWDGGKLESPADLLKKAKECVV